MIKVSLKPGNSPTTLEGFGDDVERSVKGSLHLFPNTFREITSGELDWIRTNRPELYQKLFVVSLNPSGGSGGGGGGGGEQQQPSGQLPPPKQRESGTGSPYPPDAPAPGSPEAQHPTNQGG